MQTTAFRTTMTLQFRANRPALIRKRSRQRWAVIMIKWRKARPVMALQARHRERSNRVSIPTSCTGVRRRPTRSRSQSQTLLSTTHTMPLSCFIFASWACRHAWMQSLKKSSWATKTIMLMPCCLNANTLIKRHQCTAHNLSLRLTGRTYCHQKVH